MNPDRNSSVGPEDSPVIALNKVITHYCEMLDSLREQLGGARADSERHLRWYMEAIERVGRLEARVIALEEENDRLRGK
jgi:hypothetical protein